MTPRQWTRADDDALDLLMLIDAFDPYATPIPCRSRPVVAPEPITGYTWRGEGNGEPNAQP